MASLFDVIDRSTEGGLAARLREMRSQGLSMEEMADLFAAEGIDVSRETVRRWCKQVEVPTHRVPA